MKKNRHKELVIWEKHIKNIKRERQKWKSYKKFGYGKECINGRYSKDAETLAKICETQTFQFVDSYIKNFDNHFDTSEKGV